MTLRRTALTFAALLFATALAGILYQTIGRALDAHRFPEPGRFIAHHQIDCQGQGSPTVILASGLGDTLEAWTTVQPEIAKFTRVCSYDRAGYGTSDEGPFPRTSRQIALELEALLRAAGVRPPFLLVGHSFGGYNVRVFRGLFPAQVSGMVLVDSPQEDQYNLLPPSWQTYSDALAARYQSQARWAPIFIGMGIGRFLLDRQGVTGSRLILQQKTVRTRPSELENMRQSAEQVRQSGTLGDKPLTVLAAGRQPDPEYTRIWINDIQPRLARLSTQGHLIVVPDSGHDMPTDRPAAIIAAVRDLIQKEKTR